MQLKNVAGQPVDIPLDEITRAASALGWAHSPAMHGDHPGHTNELVEMLCATNKHYLHKALDNIERLTSETPTNEGEMKDMAYRKLHMGSREETDLWYECVEAICGWYGEKMLNSLK